jgi:hypothetical protein
MSYNAAIIPKISLNFNGSERFSHTNLAETPESQKFLDAVCSLAVV